MFLGACLRILSFSITQVAWGALILAPIAIWVPLTHDSSGIAVFFLIGAIVVGFSRAPGNALAGEE